MVMVSQRARPFIMNSPVHGKYRGSTPMHHNSSHAGNQASLKARPAPCEAPASECGRADAGATQRRRAELGNVPDSYATGQGSSTPSSYSTFIKHNPWGGAVGPAARRSHAASACASHSSSLRPDPTSTRLPTMVRTMECRNALPVMVNAISSSPS